LYLTRCKSKHYSQFAEDISVVRFFPKRYKGIFVDVGCFHPKKYNNTWLLYKKGWSGVNIDIDPIKITAFNFVRRKDHNVACAIGSVPGEIEYYTRGFYSLTTSTSKDFASNSHPHIKKETTARRLDDVLETSPIANKQIDFLSIDAEGNDFEVLKSLNFHVYKPTVVAIESNKTMLEDVLNTQEYLFLKEIGYDLSAWCGLTLIFKNQAFIRKE
jgi:FkbM family methyltransferase